MTALRSLATCRFVRLLVMWSMAFVLPLQVAAVGVFAAKGPAHVHSARPAAKPVPEEMRRARSAPQVFVHVATPKPHSHSHSHGDHAEQRHHHDHDDASVVATHTDSPETDEAVGPSGLPVLALSPGFGSEASRAGSMQAVSGGGWSLRTGFVVPAERPPRQG